MSTIFSFGQNDIVRNVLRANPSVEFFIYQNETFYNNYPLMSGAFTSSVPNVPPGHLNLYEYNVDRTDQSDLIPGGTGFIKPLMTKDGYLLGLKTVSHGEFTQAVPGTQFEGDYSMSSSISREYFAADHEENYFAQEADKDNTTGEFNRVVALKNTLNHYSGLSKHYLFYNPASGTVDGDNVGTLWNKGKQVVNLISIPSIFYGSSIEKGTVELDFYISGTLLARLNDVNKNGELIQVTGTSNLYSGYGSGAVAGVVLYNEGFIVLTGSWNLANPAHTEKYQADATSYPSQWIYYGAGCETASLSYDIPSSSFALRFSGTTETSVTTLFAHARAGQLNHSNNPTYIQFSQSLQPLTGSKFYREPENLIIKNTISGAFTDMTESFQKQTFVSKIKIYDENMNCIGIAKPATPIPKKVSRDLTFKLKIDI